jgi:hypothetical protein
MQLSSVISVLIVLAANAAAAVVLLLLLLLAMNGYAESDAWWGLGAFLLLALVATALAAVSAYALLKMLGRKGLGGFAAGSLASVGGVIFGIVLQLIGAVAAVAVAEFVRVSF